MIYEGEIVGLALIMLIPLLLTHLYAGTARDDYSAGAISTVIGGLSIAIVYSLIMFASSPKIDFWRLVGATFVFGATIFIAVSEILRRGLSRALTRWRGEKWIKELDYVYLLLGALGIVLTINRIDVVDGSLSIPEFYGPFLITLALVVRAIKTRGEINDWNKAYSGNAHN